MSDSPEHEEPNFEDLAYEMAIDTVARSFKDLRKRGLSIMEAASIVAAIMTQGQSDGKNFSDE